MPAIEVDHVTKEFRLGAVQSAKRSLVNAGKRLIGRTVEEQPLFKALDDVSFSIEPGEVVGIIGHNGAGKSTLLKLLARISSPTRGNIVIRGRVAPLIEVGAGFVPDFTGRENVYLNGSILGMSRKEIDRKFDEIVDFSEIAEFIDTPVKRYSSGMQVKLAFAVATSVESEVLIVDEVLAVGDIAFQQKCIERVEKLLRTGQRTVLIVGHNIRQLQRVCSRVLLLDHGRLARDGNATTVCAAFYDEAQRKNLSRHVQRDDEIEPQVTADIITVRRLAPQGVAPSEAYSVGLHEAMTISVDFSCCQRLTEPEIVLGLHTPDFVHVLSVGNASLNPRPSFDPGTHTVHCRIDDVPLRPGNYAFRLAFLDRFRRMLWYAENIRPLTVAPGRFDIATMPEAGLVHVPATWHFDQPSGSDANAAVTSEDSPAFGARNT